VDGKEKTRMLTCNVSVLSAANTKSERGISSRRGLLKTRQFDRPMSNGMAACRVKIPHRKVWLTPTARVSCSNAANIGERTQNLDAKWILHLAEFRPLEGKHSQKCVYILIHKNVAVRFWSQLWKILMDFNIFYISGNGMNALPTASTLFTFILHLT